MIQATPVGLGATYRDIQSRPSCEIASSISEIEFLYTGGWGAFTSACCCRDQYDASANANATLPHTPEAGGGVGPMSVELWTCPDLSPTNGTSALQDGGTPGRPPPLLHKLRTRVVRDPQNGAVLASGLHLRPFCSPVFAPGISLPAYDEASLAFVVSTANGSAVPSNLW